MVLKNHLLKRWTELPLVLGLISGFSIFYLTQMPGYSWETGNAAWFISGVLGSVILNYFQSEGHDQNEIATLSQTTENFEMRPRG